MRFVTIEQARPGAILGAPVTDRRGRLLIPEGTHLSERQIDALRMWGVTHVCVEGRDPEAEPPRDLDPEALEEIRAEVEHRFMNTDLWHPLIAELFECAIARRAVAAREGAES